MTTVKTLIFKYYFTEENNKDYYGDLFKINQI